MLEVITHLFLAAQKDVKRLEMQANPHKCAFYPLIISRSCRHSSMVVSSSSWALLRRLPKTKSPSSSGREEVSCSAGSPNPTVTWLRPSVLLPTTLCQGPTNRCAPTTSSLTLRVSTSRRWLAVERCGRPPPRGLSTASRPSASSLCLQSEPCF